MLVQFTRLHFATRGFPAPYLPLTSWTWTTGFCSKEHDPEFAQSLDKGGYLSKSSLVEKIKTALLFNDSTGHCCNAGCGRMGASLPSLLLDVLPTLLMCKLGRHVCFDQLWWFSFLNHSESIRCTVWRKTTSRIMGHVHLDFCMANFMPGSDDMLGNRESVTHQKGGGTKWANTEKIYRWL